LFSLDVTGPKDATRGIVTIYDIFGFYPQTLQGADILSTSDDHHKYQVFIPDWFNGEPCPLEWFPPDTEEKQKNLGAFFQKNPPPSVAAKVPEYVKALSAQYPAIQTWAILGVRTYGPPPRWTTLCPYSRRRGQDGMLTLTLPHTVLLGWQGRLACHCIV
jgi:hypothetical protein